MSGFDTNELDFFANELLNIASNQMPKKTKKFMNQEGQKLKKQSKQKAKNTVKKKTGSYLKGIKKGKVYTKNGTLAIRVYGNTNHSHFIEKGAYYQKIVKNGAALGRARAFHILDKSAREFQQEFQKDIENFIDEVADEI